MSMQPVDLVFWPASARVHGFRGHCAAARAGEFTSLAIAPETYLDALESGLTPRDMMSMAADAGAPLRYLDSLTDWAPIRVPTECSPDLRARFDVSTDHAFRICERLGLTSILAVPGYDAGAIEQSRLIDGFGRLCERAQAQGYWVDLEFMPFRGLTHLSDAWGIVGAVDPVNAGILLDTWHYSKGDRDLELLTTIPGRFLAGMQISDGSYKQVGRSLFDDTNMHRNFPLEGEFDVVGILRIIAAKGHLRHVGPEVFSGEADALTAVQTGHRSGDTTREALRRAGIPFAQPEARA